MIIQNESVILNNQYPIMANILKPIKIGRAE